MNANNAYSFLGYRVDQWCGRKTIQLSDKITHIQKLLHLKKKKATQPNQQRAI